MRGLIDQIDHQVSVLCDTRHARARGHRAGADHALTAARSSRAMDWRTQKENAGRFSWTLGLYGTPAMAAEAKLSEEEYWEQITPRASSTRPTRSRAGARSAAQINEYVERLNALPIEHAARRRARTSTCASRSASGASGWAAAAATSRASRSSRARTGAARRAGSRFNQPLYRYGNLITGIRLEFEDGVVTKASADENEHVLQEMVATENADKVGEYSLTDRRFSRITKFMAETLFDENVGGPFGNTHLAARQVLPRLLRGRSRRRGGRQSGSALASTSRASTPTSSPPRTGR